MRGPRVLVALAAGVVVLLMAAYLAARNYSAYPAQPGLGNVMFRLIVSAILLAPGIVLWTHALRARQDRTAVLALALTVPWFVVAGAASFTLGV